MHIFALRCFDASIRIRARPGKVEKFKCRIVNLPSNIYECMEIYFAAESQVEELNPVQNEKKKKKKYIKKIFKMFL